MERSILIIFVLFLSVQLGKAQTITGNENLETENIEQNNNAVYLSLGVLLAGLYSLNYERRIGE